MENWEIVMAEQIAKRDGRRVKRGLWSGLQTRCRHEQSQDDVRVVKDYWKECRWGKMSRKQWVIPFLETRGWKKS